METPRSKPVHARDVERTAPRKRPMPPSVDRMLRWPAITALEPGYGHVPLVEALRDAAEAMRKGEIEGDEGTIAG
jgi:hypothetical protein